MRPSALQELLVGDSILESLGIVEDRIMEAQSVDERWKNTGRFLTFNLREPSFSTISAISKGPRTLEVNVHQIDDDRDYTAIDKILNRIDEIYLPIEDFKGTDGVRVSQVRRGGRSGNDVDEAWHTITRQGTYRVSYDEYAS